MDSTGAFRSITSGVTAPNGVAIDTFSEIFFSGTSANAVYESYQYSTEAFQDSGSGTDACTYLATTACYLYNEEIEEPRAMSMDSSDQLFVTDALLSGAAVFNPVTDTVTRIFNPFYYQSTASAFAVDANGNSYTAWIADSLCEIVYQNYYDAYDDTQNYQKLAGGRNCGFSGDGGVAGNAEIGASMGQIAFDVAGNLYFTDTTNQRVRRIDEATGIINTIAGNGGTGWSGDGGPATAAQVASPTGVGVDSQGQVYIISNAPAAGSGQLVRKTGPNGALSFANQVKGTVSAAKPLTIANTGNSVLNISKAVLAIGNSGDFAVDPNTTTCDLSGAGALQSGQSCKVGVIFKPSTTGLRSASLVFLDNTVTNSNTVLLSGTAVLPSATIAITTPVANASFTSGTAIKFGVSVTSAAGAAPTGTVTFLVDGSTYTAGVSLASGAASANVTGLAVGTHTLGVTYFGDANYAPGGPVSETIKVTAAAAKAKATVALSSVSSRTASCPVSSWTATVAGSSGVEPTGTVKLMDGAMMLLTSDLSAGRALMGKLSLGAGSHLLTVEYGGDATYAPTSSPIYKTTGNACGSRIDTPVIEPRGPVTGEWRER